MIKARHQWLFIPDIEKKKRTYELRLGYESRLSTSHSKAFLGASVWFRAAASGAFEFCQSGVQSCLDLILRTALLSTGDGSGRRCLIMSVISFVAFQ
jgi:hypothetical protein